ncbi:VTT domain-containing protein [Chloroflexota bacterium]
MRDKNMLNHDSPDEIKGKRWAGKKFIPILTLLLVVAITIGIFYFYRQYPSRIEVLRNYGYLGAFLISLIFNATVILPAGNILIISTLGAVLPSATMVGLAGGAGAAIGEITGYMVGYSGRGVARRSRLYYLVEGWVRRWEAVAIFIFALIPFIFDFAAIAAGILRFPFWKFFLLCWLGRTIAYIVVAWVGAWSWVVVLSIAAFALGLVIINWEWKRYR